MEQHSLVLSKNHVCLIAQHILWTENLSRLRDMGKGRLDIKDADGGGHSGHLTPSPNVREAKC